MRTAPSQTLNALSPRVLLVAPTLGIMGGQAVQAAQLLEKLRGEGMLVDLLPINPVPPGILRHALRIKYLRTVVVSFFYIVSLIRRIPHYDVIHIFSASYFSFILAPTPAILLARFYGKASILNYRSGEADDHFEKWGRLVFPIIRLVSRIVTPSGYLVAVFGRWGFRAEAIVNFVGEEVATFRHRKTAQPRIIVARALEPLYNVACAIRAFALVKEKYPRAELVILGSGSQEMNLKNQVTELRLNGVTFAGRVERTDIARHYDWADVFLNTSSIDNMPVSILEAFASGLPIVTTDAGGIPYIIRNGENGFLSPLDDPVRLAERIIGLVENPSVVARLSAKGATEIALYRWPVVSRQWRSLYEALKREGVPPPRRVAEGAEGAAAQ